MKTVKTSFNQKVTIAPLERRNLNENISYDVASGSEIMPCIKINKSLVVYRFSGTCNVMN